MVLLHPLLQDHQETATLIWEYAGEDEDPGSYTVATPENLLYSSETSDFNGADPENPQLETLTLDELFNRLQNDPTLAGQYHNPIPRFLAPIEFFIQFLVTILLQLSWIRILQKNLAELYNTNF